MFSETKSVLDFCLEIGSVTADGKPTYDIRTNNDANHRNYGKQHILFKDADASTATVIGHIHSLCILTPVASLLCVDNMCNCGK